MVFTLAPLLPYEVPLQCVRNRQTAVHLHISPQRALRDKTAPPSPKHALSHAAVALRELHRLVLLPSTSITTARKGTRTRREARARARARAHSRCRGWRRARRLRHGARRRICSALSAADVDLAAHVHEAARRGLLHGRYPARGGLSALAFALHVTSMGGLSAFAGGHVLVRVDAHLRAHVPVLFFSLRLLSGVRLPVHVLSLRLLERHRTVHRHVAPVPANRARHVRHLVALVVVLRTLEGEVPKSPTQRALLVTTW